MGWIGWSVRASEDPDYGVNFTFAINVTAEQTDAGVKITGGLKNVGDMKISTAVLQVYLLSEGKETPDQYSASVNFEPILPPKSEAPFETTLTGVNEGWTTNNMRIEIGSVSLVPLDPVPNKIIKRDSSLPFKTIAMIAAVVIFIAWLRRRNIRNSKEDESGSAGGDSSATGD